MHRESMMLMRYFRNRYVLRRKTILTVLDVGSMDVQVTSQGTYRDIFRRSIYTGMDIIEGKNVDIVGYENITKRYDIVISGQVMEHVSRPWEWLKNLAGYYKKYICIIAPHAFGEHRYPLDAYRFLPDGMRDLFEYAGIKEIEILKGRYDTMGIGGK